MGIKGKDVDRKFVVSHFIVKKTSNIATTEMSTAEAWLKIESSSS